jgi:uncharacterized protein with HEPN domain
MSAPRIFEDYLRDILEHTEAAMAFVEAVPSAAAMAQDKRTFLAVIRALEVIGEAAKQIPPTERAKYPELPWRAMARMREKVIHHYFGVDPQVVWETVHTDLPPLRASVARILERLAADC